MKWKLPFLAPTFKFEVNLTVSTGINQVKKQNKVSYDERANIITKMDTHSIGTFWVDGNYGEYFNLCFTGIGLGNR